jgi:hypothetical protein
MQGRTEPRLTFNRNREGEATGVVFHYRDQDMTGGRSRHRDDRDVRDAAS